MILAEDHILWLASHKKDVKYLFSVVLYEVANYEECHHPSKCLCFQFPHQFEW